MPLAGSLRYMQRALVRYRFALDVACISGYGPPDVRRPRECEAVGYFTCRISSWGWGPWRRSWANLAVAWEPVRQQACAVQLDDPQVGADLREWLKPHWVQRVGKTCWTPLWLFSTLLRGGKTLWLFRSYAETIGRDGSGTNCPKASESVSQATPPPNASEFRFPPTTTLQPAIARSFGRAICGRNRPLWKRALDRLRHHRRNPRPA